MKSSRYFIDTDNSGHAYVVEESHREDWYTWLTIDEDDPDSWDVPSYARRINGASSRVTFCAPEFDECE